MASMECKSRYVLLIVGSVSAVWVCMLLITSAWPQNRGERDSRFPEILQRLGSLERSVRRLEQEGRDIIANGFVDLSDEPLKFRIRPTLGVLSVRPSDARPGIFEIQFSPAVARAPIVIATASNRWGKVPK